MLTNYGTLELRQAANGCTLGGSGRVENFGLVWVSQAGASSYVPMTIHPGGNLVVGPSAALNLYTPGALTVAGGLEVQSGGRLSVNTGGFTAGAGAQVIGSGYLNWGGATNVVMAGNVTMETRLECNAGTRVRGSGELTLVGEQSVTGTMEVPVVVGVH